MHDPFKNRSPSLSGPATDIIPITPADGTDLPSVCVALYVETGGTLAITTQAGAARSVTVGDRAILPVGTRQVAATGTTASGIHGFVVN
ncbi:hypothetical protein FHY55_05530 [Oceanicola sp. D3]|uniref:spike base protein, RCAP_Rcc01079 family n=1 Tax=Oceanicola sp. D3 TaxID=2587163 RepID=UPI00111E8135|nr:hypothetical protein [Oceanicola sp. D3]QDC08731.1 hypothetical protein FHY55_05530 [Oceanicola sp. D3]